MKSETRPDLSVYIPFSEWSQLDLTAEQWQLLHAMFPPPSPALRGRSPLDERAILDGILWKIRNLAPWYDLPSSYPSWQTCYRRYRLWQRTGLLKEILSLLSADLHGRGAFDYGSAFHNETFRLVRRAGHITVAVDPRWQGTWQLSTARVFLALALRELRQRSRRASSASSFYRSAKDSLQL